MSSGKIAAQCVHAALGFNKLGVDYNQPESYCLDPMLSVVALEVSDAKFEAAKTEMAQKASQAYIVKDAGYTEILAGSETVLAFLENDPRMYNENLHSLQNTEDSNVVSPTEREIS